MTITAEEFVHERVVVRRGERSGFPVIVSVHSTALGSAVGGCRLWAYPNWRDGLSDALRLSKAMSLKCAAAGLAHGGGKTVIAVPPAVVLTPEMRVRVMRDLGDVIESFGGDYIVGSDVGTHAADMAIVRERTAWAPGPQPVDPGSANLPEPTSAGVLASIEATARHAWGSADLSGRRITVVGLGNVGMPLARQLAHAGAKLIVADIDQTKQNAAKEMGAAWKTTEDALASEADILVPAALGGVFSSENITSLRCAAIVGPANNQLVEDNVAELLAARQITWAPDFIVNAGGVVFGVGVGLDGLTPNAAHQEVLKIGARLETILERAATEGKTPLAVATQDAQERIAGRTPETVDFFAVNGRSS